MVTAVFYFTDWDIYPADGMPQNSTSVWVHDVHAFGADRIIMIDQTRFKIGQYYEHGEQNTIFERYDSLEECMEKYKDKRWIFLENVGTAENLEDFIHPKEDCFYVVGPDFSRILSKNDPNYWVRISMVNYRPLYAHVAMMVVLYDRMIKLKK